jgi:hypothetical protein
MPSLRDQFGSIDIYLFDQILRDRITPGMYIFVVIGAALMLLLCVIGRRFGWKGQVLSLAILDPCQVVRERLWFGEFILALNYQPGLDGQFRRDRRADGSIRKQE